MAKDDPRLRIMAHCNQFQVGDWISFYFNGPGEEQEGELIQILDCVEGLVKTKYGTFRTRLSTAKILKRVPHPGDYEVTDCWEPMDDSGT